MIQVCPKCGHERGLDEVVPDYECPRCGIVYQKYLDRQEMLALPEMSPAEAGLPGLTERSADPSRPPVESPIEPRSYWRLAGLIVAGLLVILVVAVAARGGLRSSSWSDVPYDIRGTWSGVAVERVALRDRPPYEARFIARFTVDENYQLSEIEWTACHNLLKQETVYWRWPRTVSFTSQRREGASAPFLVPPQGSYTQLLFDDGELTVDSRQVGGAALERLEATFPVSTPSTSVFWTNGVFSRLKKEEAIEAVARGGFATFGPIELDPADVVMSFPPSAAADAFRPYLRGSKTWPEGMSDDPMQPSEGLELDGAEVLDAPGLTFSIQPVRALFANRDGGRRAGGQAVDWVELMPESRISARLTQAKSWAAHVVFYRDGRAMVRLPHRDLEIPVEREGEAPVAEAIEKPIP